MLAITPILSASIVPGLNPHFMYLFYILNLVMTES